MGQELLRGNLGMLLLALLSEQPLHGYALITELRQRGGRALHALPEGSAYPALHRLERDGLISSTWSLRNGRRRRVYQITPEGRRALAQQRDEWLDFATAVLRILGGAHG